MVMDFDLENRRITPDEEGFNPRTGKSSRSEKVAATSEEPSNGGADG